MTMQGLLAVIGVLLLIAFGPAILIGVGIYVVVFYILGGLLQGLFGGDSGGGGRSGGDGDHWHGTGNPHV